MDNTQQRERLHTTVSGKTKQVLEEIRKREGFYSSSQVIEWLVLNDSIGQRIDALIKVIEGRYVHKQHIPGKQEPRVVGPNRF